MVPEYIFELGFSCFLVFQGMQCKLIKGTLSGFVKFLDNFSQHAMKLNFFIPSVRNLTNDPLSCLVMNKICLSQPHKLACSKREIWK